MIVILTIFAVIAYGEAQEAKERAARAMDNADRAEREVRIILDDFKYIRAWARQNGMPMPRNHEEAED